MYVNMQAPKIAARQPGLGGCAACGGLGAFDLSSTILGLPAGVVIGAGAVLTYVLFFGTQARGRRGALSEENRRHRDTVRKIRREYARV